MELDDQALRRMLVHKMMLSDWNNTRFNLTTISGDRETALKHFLDSLAASLAVKFDKQRVIDIGTGAGFPGVPLKIAFPSINLTLLDSKEKKAAFVTMLLRRLEFDSEVRIIVARGEDIGKDSEFRGMFDVSTMRGVSKIPINAEIGLPLVKIGGKVILWKGKKDVDKLNKYEEFIDKLGGRVSKVIPYNLGDIPGERYLLVLEKVRETPSKYPRRYSTMRKALRKQWNE
ncbi:MAG: 16S rRNA (guanine(527)-N(7))-methyltransferase RsmG [Caldisericaceae bacterium]|nr:16S rRNA (guanine(527)-N(7))-methyltransferase RsmG [Caldisericaceae bacterium]